MPQACLGKTEYRNFHAVTWQLISHYGGQAAAESNHQCQWDDQFHAMEPKKEAVDLHFFYWWSTNLCFTRLYTYKSNGQTRDQVKAIFFLFSAAVTKTGGWTTSLFWSLSRRSPPAGPVGPDFCWGAGDYTRDKLPLGWYPFILLLVEVEFFTDDLDWKRGTAL